LFSNDDRLSERLAKAGEATGEKVWRMPLAPEYDKMIDSRFADVLWYVAKKHKPKFMIDLATLTGAIMVALGTEHAGLFSNNDELADRLLKVGRETGERVWRMPLAPEYDKLIDSQFADMKNTGGRYGGSITAAQFLQRFVDDTPWAHLDIAGTAMGAPKSEINQSWGSGFGVRLLERLVAEYYEK
jgi:leucyl aminopeptidase